MSATGMTGAGTGSGDEVVVPAFGGAEVASARGVECYVPVKTPAHRSPEFRSDVWLPESERAAAETLALPLRASMTKRELHRLVSACNELGGLLLDAAC